jgi:Family of unknown function (DUF5719)
MRLRLVVLIVVAAALALLALGARDIPVTRTVAAPDPSLDGASVTAAPGASGSIWFCPTGMAATPTTPTHRVTIANPTKAAMDATVRGWTTAGQPGAPRNVPIPAQSSTVVNAANGSVMVELSAGGATVSHELSSGGLWDEDLCSSQPSDEAYFPSIDTRRGNSARLTLLNPFQSDAVVKVTVSTADTVRVPNQLNGLVIPGGTSKTIELNTVVERRATFSASVSGSGRFIAELSQYDAGQASPEDGTQSPLGLVLQLGAPRLVQHQLFADGLVTAGMSEMFVIANPTGDPARVSLSVLPFDADPAARPQPFVLDVGANRSVVVQLDKEARVPPDTPHWVRLDVVQGRGVVAQRVVAVAGANSLALAGGLASTMGTPRAATRWIVPGLDPSQKTGDSLAIADPAVSGTAKVTISTFAAGAVAAPAASATVEIGAGKGALVSLAPILAASPKGSVIGLVVTSDHPIGVERRGITSTKHDFAAVAGSPVAGSLSDLPALTAQIAASGGS